MALFEYDLFISYNWGIKKQVDTLFFHFYFIKNLNTQKSLSENACNKFE